jgi:hypothetical protein
MKPMLYKRGKACQAENGLTAGGEDVSLGQGRVEERDEAAQAFVCIVSGVAGRLSPAGATGTKKSQKSLNGSCPRGRAGTGLGCLESGPDVWPPVALPGALGRGLVGRRSSSFPVRNMAMTEASSWALAAFS